MDTYISSYACFIQLLIFCCQKSWVILLACFGYLRFLKIQKLQHESCRQCCFLYFEKVCMDLCVICECLYEFIFWGGDVWNRWCIFGSFLTHVLHRRLEASKRGGLLQFDMLFNLPTHCHNINWIKIMYLSMNSHIR